MNIKIKTTMNLCKTALGLMVSMMIFSWPAFSLPQHSRSTKINDFQAYAISQDEVLSGSQIISDDKKNTLYISPSSKKTQTGLFQQTAYPACNVLKDQYDLTFLMPNITPNRYAEFAKNGPYSPFFDSRIGNYVRHAGTLQLITEKLMNIDKIKSENKLIIESYENFNFLFLAAQAEYNAAEASYQELTTRIDTLYSRLIMAKDPEERAIIEKSIAEAVIVKNEEKEGRRERLRNATRNLMTIKYDYANAKAKYETTVPNLINLKSDVVTLSEIFDILNNLSINNFMANEKALQDFENVSVGVTSASYSIWGDEESRLRNILSSSRNSVYSYFNGHNVTRLPIHNVRLKKPNTTSIASNISGVFNGDTSIASARLGESSDSLALKDKTTDSKLTTFTKDNYDVTPQINELSGDGSGTFINPVTRGAYCTGSSTRPGLVVETSFKYLNLDNKTTFKIFEYRPRTTNALAQTVALEYEYYVRSEPIGVRCTMDIAKFRSQVVNSGSTGALLWRTDWSESERRQIDNLGIACNVLLSPTGNNPDYKEQHNYIESIRKDMMQAIAAEFLFTYAKTWSTNQSKSSIPNGKPRSEPGAALAGLCGDYTYCVIGSVVLKTADELFGSHADKVNNREFLSGTIRRAYDESSWTTSIGHSTISLLVKI